MSKDQQEDTKDTDALSYREMAFRYADTTDKCHWVLGILCTIVWSCSIPAFCLAFGSMSDSLTSGNFDELNEQALFMVYIGVGVMIFISMQISFISVFSSNVVHKIKVDYFRKCLLKDAEYYDIQNPNEMAIKIGKETDAIHKGIGEKAGIVVMSFSTFFLGFIFAFFLGWKLTLILMGALPILGMIGAGMSLSTMSGFSEEMKAYA